MKYVNFLVCSALLFSGNKDEITAEDASSIRSNLVVSHTAIDTPIGDTETVAILSHEEFNISTTWTTEIVDDYPNPNNE